MIGLILEIVVLKTAR